MVVFGMVCLVYLSERNSAPRLRCGHVNEAGFIDWISGKRHHCEGSRLVRDLYMLQLAQGMFRADFSRTATNFAELSPYAPGVKPTAYTLQYKAERNLWSVSVEKNNKLPGYYLLSADNLFFNEQHPATTNDLCIATLKIE